MAHRMHPSDEMTQAAVAPGTSGTTPHKFLAIPSPFVMSRQDAEERLMKAVHAAGSKISKSKLQAAPFTVTDHTGKETKLVFAKVVDEIRRTGVVTEFDRLRWVQTLGFGTVSLAKDFEGLGMMISRGPRDSAPLEGVGCCSNDVVGDLLEDTLAYRQETVDRSDFSDGFRACFRSYRAYLSTGISAVDGFLNTLTWYASRDLTRGYTEAETKVLQNRYLSFGKKLEQWIPLLTHGSKLDKTSASWGAFDSLRNGRNGFVHVNEPDYNFELRSAADMLNVCRSGIGQFLVDLCALLKQAPHPLMLQVCHAPTVVYVSKPPVP